MVYEWRWEMAYLGALGRNDADLAQRLRNEFIQYSVRQTLLDCARCRLLFGEDFKPSLLLHMVIYKYILLNFQLVLIARFVFLYNAVEHRRGFDG